MKQTTIVLILAGCFLTFSASQSENSARNRLLKATGPSKASLPPVLFDINNQAKIFKEKEKVRPTKFQPKLLPLRVYLIFHKRQKKWLYALTDFEGYLPSPFEAFRSLTVLPGKYLGGNKTHRYQLNAQGIWVRTFQSEQHFMWVYSKLPKIKTVTFKPVAAKKR